MDMHAISYSSKAVKCMKKQPFTSSERKLIIALVRERPIIEDKHTNYRNIELKKKAWADLTVAFNAQPYVSQRSHKQLKRCWENIKCLRRKELFERSRSIKLTGRGPPQDLSTATSDSLKVPCLTDLNTIEISQDLCLQLTDPQNNDEVISVEGNEIGEAETVLLEKCESNENVHAALLKRNYNKDISSTPTSVSQLESEIDVRKKRCIMNIQQDKELHELRMAREKILIERENNMLQYEKELHRLQLEKIKIEIEMLKNKNS